MDATVERSVMELMKLFPGSFINHNFELILDPKMNLYFCLKDIPTVEALKYKVIEWCSRAACKSEPYRQTWRNERWQEKIRIAINAFLAVDFTKDEWMLIYSYLGNSCNRSLCVKFCESKYDLNVIRDYARERS